MINKLATLFYILDGKWKTRPNSGRSGNSIPTSLWSTSAVSTTTSFSWTADYRCPCSTNYVPDGARSARTTCPTGSAGFYPGSFWSTCNNATGTANSVLLCPGWSACARGAEDATGTNGVFFRVLLVSLCNQDNQFIFRGALVSICSLNSKPHKVDVKSISILGFSNHLFVTSR